MMPDRQECPSTEAFLHMVVSSRKSWSARSRRWVEGIGRLPRARRDVGVSGFRRPFQFIDSVPQDHISYNDLTTKTCGLI